MFAKLQALDVRPVVWISLLVGVMSISYTLPKYLASMPEIDLPTSQSNQPNATQANPTLNGAFPTSGTTHYYSPIDRSSFTAVFRVTSAGNKELRHMIGFASGGKPYAVMYLDPGQVVEMSLPPGAYEVSVASGTIWNGSAFDDTSVLSFKQPLLAVAGQKAVVNVAQ